MSGSRATPPKAKLERINGLVERVTFHNPENGFCVLRVKQRRQRELTTVVGRAPSVSPGEYIAATGQWQNDRTHGTQFRADELEVTPPSSKEGIERYLASGMIKGVGPELAKRLVKHFGEDVFDVIERSSARLREVQGVGDVRSQRIVDAWKEQRRIREIMVFLHTHGLGTSRAVRIYKTYGADAVALIQEDPYRLARDVRGIGFATADALGARFGIAPTALIRARAGLQHTLGEALGAGHCGLPRDSLLSITKELLDVPLSRIEEALQAEVEAGHVVEGSIGDRECVFLEYLHRAEKVSAERLLRLAAGKTPWPEIEPNRALDWVEKKLHLELADSQRRALTTALRSKVLVITGGPGVGKTTLLNSILEILRAKKVKAALAAPTGRAAKRLSEATGLEAKTIHRLLEADPRTGGFRRNENNPLECDLLVVDESSMVDVSLLCSLLRAMPDEAALFLVGDVDQLPSVGPGQVLADVIASEAIAVVTLREIYRQAAESRIVTSAHRINQGELPDLAADSSSDFFFIEASDPDETLRRLITVVRERIPKRFGLDPVRDVQVLTPMHRGTVGARSLNVALQEALVPARPGLERVERFGFRYGIGDKVMQIENDYDKDVYNGDVGFVVGLDLGERELCVEFDGRAVVYGFDELDSLSLAFATTIHKAQGSEYPAVVIPLTTQHYPMLKRNLVYTAVTRGRKLVVLIGQKRALGIAVGGERSERRWSKLGDWLAAG